MSLIDFLLGSKDDDAKPSVIKQFLKDPDEHKILIETVNDEIVIRIRRKQ